MAARILLLFVATALFGAEDSWDKVRELKTGTELRITKKDGKAPLLATMDEADAERIVVVIKREQVAIPKAEIDRLEFRPAGRGQTRVTRESKMDNDALNKDVRQAKPGDRPAVPGGTSSGGLTFGGKPEFQMIYRRSAGAPK